MNCTASSIFSICLGSVWISILCSTDEDGHIIRRTLNLKKIRDDEIIRKINEMSGHSEPCVCCRCNPDTSGI